MKGLFKKQTYHRRRQSLRHRRLMARDLSLQRQCRCPRYKCD